ncbi:outer membrane lipoprotein carrier protein LolA [Roseateles oligotrophus]|uniref:Outer membrane lipoprotein carrier protein LolA n=1 Tax=Roseateles oligotrophus TaxID=1769250 RepID=A0ABT2YDE9_9BURK|nr:outer membrane lipoprotein carrier protein LolA [Roseateles oligotrophus]MCV2368078.1 outer membrane lipoprotein carrier protein LolA [Roseateles oligotrophus]
MKRLLLLLASSLGLMLPAWSGDLASEIRSRLSQPEVLHGDFEQAKTVSGFAKPLQSRGDFLVARGRGVLWRTVEPFASELRLTRDEIKASQGGSVSFKLDAAKEPTVRVINGLMFALLNGDVARLSELFEFSGAAQGKSWNLTLTPKQLALARLLKRVELHGDSLVRRIVLDEANGDVTQIRFLNQRGEAAALSSADQARFD